MKTYLIVGWQDAGIVKAMGARFNMGLKQWYVPDGVDNTPFKKWFVTAGLSFEHRKKAALDKWRKDKNDTAATS